MARDIFSSEHVRKALDEFIHLIIQTAQELKDYYAKPKRSMFYPTHSAKYYLTLKMDAELFVTAFAATRREEIQRLEQKLEEHKSNISQAFLVEVRAEVSKIQESVQAMGSDNDEERNKVLLDKLLPPVNSRWHGRTYCCDGTRRGILDKIDSWVGAGLVQECAGDQGHRVHHLASSGSTALPAAARVLFQLLSAKNWAPNSQDVSFASGTRMSDMIVSA